MTLTGKLQQKLFEMNLSIPAELLFAGTCSRPWIFDHGTCLLRQVDYGSIGSDIEAWYHEHTYTKGRMHWRDFSLEDIAEGTGVPVGHVRNWFQLAAQVNFRVWKMERRIALARELIGKEGLSMKQVSERAGFRDMNNFSRQFRRITGCSPNHWKSAPSGTDPILSDD